MLALALLCAHPTLAPADPAHATTSRDATPAPAATRLTSVPSLPAPDGPWTIGTLVMDWTDSEREETWTEDPNDRRRLVVQFWYPAEAMPLRVPAPYVLRYPQLRSSLDRYWSRPFPTMPTHAALEVAAAAADSSHPVVLFSHGMNSSRILYTALAEELASHGYVVGMIDHPHWGPGVAFDDGGTVDFSESMPGMMGLDADRMDERVQEGIATMADDQAFVARMLPRMAGDRRVNVRRLAREMDLTRIAVAGHTMGGMAAVRSAYTYRFFSAAISLDGYGWTRSGLSAVGSPAAPCDKPLLVLLSEGSPRGDHTAFARRHLDAFRDPRIVRLAGTRPGSITDACFLNPGGASAEEAHAHRLICDTIRAFLDEHLMKQGFFDDALARLDGAQRIDLPAVLDDATRAAATSGAPPPSTH